MYLSVEKIFPLAERAAVGDRRRVLRSRATQHGSGRVAVVDDRPDGRRRRGVQVELASQIIDSPEFWINLIADSELNLIINSLIALFRECIIALNETFRKAETLPQQAIREKYKAEK